jgi:hypothetical protein
LGRKSNRKKRGQELRTAIEAEADRQAPIVYGILFSGVAFFIWGMLLFARTFIYLKTQIFIILVGAAVGIIIVNFLWRHKKPALMLTLFYGSFLGGPIPYCFIATTNYYFRDNKTQMVQLDIIRTGNRSKSKTPYAVIEFEDIHKEILFHSGYEKSISKYKSLTLTVSKGLWGYTVYTDKLLND